MPWSSTRTTSMRLRSTTATRPPIGCAYGFGPPSRRQEMARATRRSSGSRSPHDHGSMCTSSGARPAARQRRLVRRVAAHGLAARDELLGMDGGLHVRARRGGRRARRRRRRRAPPAPGPRRGRAGWRAPPAAAAPRRRASAASAAFAGSSSATSTKRTSPTSGDSRRIATAAESSSAVSGSSGCVTVIAIRPPFRPPV